MDEPVEAVYTEVPEDSPAQKKETTAKSTPDTSDEDAFFADVP